MIKRFNLRHIARRLRSFRIRPTATGILGLLVVLAIGVLEPVLCIMHCTLWVPLSRSSQMAHHHHHRMPDGTLMMTAMPDSTAAPAAPGGDLAMLCVNALAPVHSPLLPSAQAFHEFTLTFALLIVVALLSSYAAAPPPSRILLGHAPPTLRPPIPLAS